MITCVQMLLLFFTDRVDFPPPGTDFRVTNNSENRVTNDGEDRITN